MLTRHTVRGDKKLDANVKAAVGVQLLIPSDGAHGAEVLEVGTTDDIAAELMVDL